MMRRAAQWLDGLHLFLPGLLFSPYYDRLDKRPGFVVKLLNSRLSRLLGIGLSSKTEFDRRWVATSMPTKSKLMENEARVPPIELLIVSAEKDFWLLKDVSNAAIRQSINPIASLNLVIPAASRARLPNLEELRVDVNVIDEESLLNEDLFDDLKRTMGARNGWLLQQYLTIKFVEESQAHGVLTLDADTFLLQKTLWLDANARQLLHVSSEFVPNYYRFLHSLGVSEEVPEETHVTHHMLMQPLMLRAILKAAGLRGSEEVLERALAYSKSFGQVEFCLEFELYAQGCKKLFRDRLELLKFGNRSVRIEKQEAEKHLKAIEKSANTKFRSVSAHSYAQ